MRGKKDEPWGFIIPHIIIHIINIRYGVVANIAVSHTAAGGSIPPIGVSFLVLYPYLLWILRRLWISKFLFKLACWGVTWRNKN
ncbi:hypothetical protein N7447_001688 [Penicillium robsamsonii]|uniref:uncharacterized protein n=1 Tax=Penicillium robsamsonii TaxID=1792511 RepID=UPI002547D912|nr:uncharacterized protein N7447_001688 [Penicillium robsamsonii]KAJ5835662.1 hypothetical protein N7447_001688 [Penicillium robsamsonii]